MAPFCRDEDKYQIVNNLINLIVKMFKERKKILNRKIINVLTINGIRFT